MKASALSLAEACATKPYKIDGMAAANKQMPSVIRCRVRTQVLVHVTNKCVLTFCTKSEQGLCLAVTPKPALVSGGISAVAKHVV